MTFEEISELVSVAAAAGVEIRITATGTVIIRPMVQVTGPISDAERARNYRERKKNVTPSVTVSPESVTNVTKCHDVTNDPPSPSPPPSSPSTPPPSPAPTPTPTRGDNARASEPTCAREAPKPPESERQAREQAAAANALSLPLSIQTVPGITAFREAWQEWCDYRTERATTGLKSARVTWTERAAKNALLEVERVAAGVGLPAITARIREAIAGNWQGLNLSTMPTPNGRTPQPTHQPPRQHDSI